MSIQYFRMMSSPEENWGPYWEDPETGRRMEFNRHLDALYASAPKTGDYLILSEDGSLSALCPNSYDQYRGVVFDDMPSLTTLLDSGVVVEVPEHIRMTDWHLQARTEALVGAIEELEEKLEELLPKLYERRFFFLTQEARDSQHIYNELKPMLNGLYSELEDVRGEMEVKVTAPLRELVELHQERMHASVDDLIFGASARGAEVLGLTKEFDVDRDFGLYQVL